MSTRFPANTVVNSYNATEATLVEFLQFVPYCEEHLNVWSPRLVTILLEACSQLDSLWAYEAAKSPFVKKDELSIGKYFRYYGENVAPKWVVFWSGEEPAQLFPFSEWRDKEKYTEKTYTDLPWWLAYNKLKHRRFDHQSLATLERAIRALAGLFVAILRCDECRLPAVHSWMDPVEHPHPAYLDDESSNNTTLCITVNTKLFTYVPYWSRRPIPAKPVWNGRDSKFQIWLEHESNKPGQALICHSCARK